MSDELLDLQLDVVRSNIRRAAEWRGLSIREAASAAGGVDPHTVYDFLAGRHVIGLDKLLRLAGGLGIHPARLLGGMEGER